MSTRTAASFVLAASVALVACQTAPAGLSPQDHTAIRDVTEGALRIANAPTKDWAAYAAAYYAEDATVLPPNAPAATGRAAIQAMMASFPPISNMKVEPTDIDGSGDTAHVRGRYSMTISPPGAAPIADSGKYVEVWHRQADGTWRVATDIFNSDLPLAAPPPAWAREINERWYKALGSSDAAGIASLYTTDAVVVPEGAAPVRGRAGVAALWKGRFAKTTYRCTFGLDGVQEAGPYASVLGHDECTETPVGGGASQIARSRWITVFEKQADGSWLLSRDASENLK